MLIIDAMLPDGDGIDLFQELQSRQDEVAAILLTRDRTLSQTEYGPASEAPADERAGN